MQIQEFTIITQDKLLLAGKNYSPEKESIAAVCIVHGLGEHMGRYRHVAAYFVERLFTVYTFDLRGHGISGGKRGHIPSYQLLLNDVERVIHEIKHAYPERPFFIYGHSMGGNIVANYILKCDVKVITAAVITSPWLKLAFAPATIKLTLGKWINTLLPSFTQATGLDAHQLTHDPAIAKAYLEDPLIHGSISAGAFMYLYEAGEWAIQHASRLTIPALLMHGSEDQITSAKATKEFADHAGKIVSFKLWEGLRHEMHNELKKEKVLNYIYQWLLEKIPASKMKR